MNFPLFLSDRPSCSSPLWARWAAAEAFLYEGWDMAQFAVVSHACVDRLPSANGGINVMFSEQLVSPLLQF